MITGIGALLLQYIVQAFELHAVSGAFFVNLSTYVPASMDDVNRIKEIYTSPVLGASGAIFGLLIAVFLLYPESEVYIYFFIPGKDQILGAHLRFVRTLLRI